MERGSRGEHRGVQGGEGDWPREDRCGWLAARSTNWKRGGLGGGRGRRGRGCGSRSLRREGEAVMHAPLWFGRE